MIEDQPKIKTRRWKAKDIPKIAECYRAAYPQEEQGRRSDEKYYQMEFDRFPEGQFLAEIDGEVIGFATSLIVQLEDDSQTYTYEEITGADTFSTHNAAGDTLYGADIAVHPKYRGIGVAGRLYRRRKALVKYYNLRRMVAYGRLPGYAAVSDQMSPDEYINKCMRGELKDSSLGAHLKAGYRVKKVLLRHIPDAAGLTHSTFLEWPNPDYDAQKRSIAVAPSTIGRMARKIRVCSAQFLMRRIHTWEDFENTVEFFADTADVYHCHFLVLPELFTAQLLCTMPPGLSFEASIERLLDLYPRYCDLMERLAVERQLYIIGGSHPVSRDGALYNTGHLFTPSGGLFTQEKLHITPNEKEDWNFRPGDKIRVFDTPYGRIAIVICYDIEFPELSRLLALAGVEIIFVPTSTDERKAYNRVRMASQACAISNYVYVAISVNVGNLPTIKNYLLNYGQSAVFTPSDHPFPTDACAAQAEPNCETVVTAELDMVTLAQQRELGSVRPLLDRRPDLYQLTAVNEVEVVRVS